MGWIPSMEITCMTPARECRTALGAQPYVRARLATVPIHVAGVPYLPTLVWTVSV
jgi:uncharacterized MAPEG superfamily protein